MRLFSVPFFIAAICGAYFLSSKLYAVNTVAPGNLNVSSKDSSNDEQQKNTRNVFNDELANSSAQNAPVLNNTCDSDFQLTFLDDVPNSNFYSQTGPVVTDITSFNSELLHRRNDYLKSYQKLRSCLCLKMKDFHLDSLEKFDEMFSEYDKKEEQVYKSYCRYGKKASCNEKKLLELYLEYKRELDGMFVELRAKGEEFINNLPSVTYDEAMPYEDQLNSKYNNQPDLKSNEDELSTHTELAYEFEEQFDREFERREKRRRKEKRMTR